MDFLQEDLGLNLVEARMKWLSGLLVRTYSPVYIFGQTADNTDSVVEGTDRFRGYILIPGEDNTVDLTGFPGNKQWVQALTSHGVKAGMILPVYGGYTNNGHGQFEGNTYTEAEAIVRYVMREKIDQFYVMGWPGHTLRCWMTSIGQARKFGYKGKIYPACGTDKPLDEVVRGPQGKVIATREKLFKIERDRINTYMAKGDIPYPEIVLRDTECLVD